MVRRRRNSTTSSRVNSGVLQFVSRADQRRIRDQRNYGRWKMVTYGFVVADGPERLAWLRESVEDSERDAAWKLRHGPIAGGASILRWRHGPASAATCEAPGTRLHGSESTPPNTGASHTHP
jgi:hypothetical protein